ncbi:hypothetical protein MJO28_013832 [Puccinia striiformis f. sp. tritici]|uniref:Uncharacterized protein n=1 Tax=Puccinia striiformis f. sp. tritici TaxID=168172 RepID=A0ACC0DWR8_9BASI|nr:hypothetical protein MJO28_013832 [Puccinia striiformis f. sp. tritici]
MFHQSGSSFLAFTLAFMSLETLGESITNQDCVPLNDHQVLLDGPTGGSAPNFPLMSTEENSSTRSMQWPSLPTNLAPPTTPSSHANSSALLHQSSSGRVNELFKRQNTTSKLFTQNMNPPPVVSPINNPNNRTGTNNNTAARTGTTANDRPKTFTESVQISGGLTRTQSTWIDGLKIDTLSVTPHVLSIRKKMNPMSAKFVTSADPSRGFLGGDWRELTSFSYELSFDGENPDDLLFKISVPYDRLQAPINVTMDDDVYLGLFDQTRGGWVIDTERMENRRRDRRVELLGIPAPSGEYRLLARSNRDAQSSMNLNFGNGPDGQFNVLAPIGFLAVPALQVGTWQDGSKVIIRSLQATQISIEIRNFTMGAIPSGYEAVGRYAFLISSTSSGAQVIMNLQLPYVPTQLEQRAIDPLDIVTAGRPLRTNQPYQILAGTTISGNGALMNVPMNIVEGEYLLLARTRL